MHAVVVDLVMPGMSGNDTLRALKAAYPDLPVIICTGYAPAAHLEAALRDSVSAVLTKPPMLETLSRALSTSSVAIS